MRPELKQSIEVTLGTDNGDNACVLVICCRNATRYARPTSHVAAHLSFHRISNVITVLTFVIGHHLHCFIQFLHLRLSCYWRTISLKMLDTEWLALTLGNWYLALKSPAGAWTEYCAVRRRKKVFSWSFSLMSIMWDLYCYSLNSNQVWSRARHVQWSARKYWTIFLFLHNLPSDVQTSFCKVHLCSVVIFLHFYCGLCEKKRNVWMLVVLSKKLGLKNKSTLNLWGEQSNCKPSFYHEQFHFICHFHHIQWFSVICL